MAYNRSRSLNSNQPRTFPSHGRPSRDYVLHEEDLEEDARDLSNLTNFLVTLNTPPTSTVLPQEQGFQPPASNLEAALRRFEASFEDLRAAIQEQLSNLRNQATLDRVSCCVCRESLVEVVKKKHQQAYSTACGHLYCEQCFDRVMLATSRSCAMCRQRIRRRDAHRIFLN